MRINARTMSTRRILVRKAIIACLFLVTVPVKSKLGEKSRNGTTTIPNNRAEANLVESLWSSILVGWRLSSKKCDGEDASASPSPSAGAYPSPYASASPSPSASVSPSASHAPTETARACPRVGEDPVEFEHDTANDEPMFLYVSERESLCLLVAVTEATTTTTKRDEVAHYVGRSYEGHPWEVLRGPWERDVHFVCDDGDGDVDVCRTTFGASAAVEKKRVGTRRLRLVALAHEEGPSLADEAARFLERTTFGPTRSGLAELVDDRTRSSEIVSASRWVRRQILDVPATSHRARFRSRATTRVATTGVGAPSRPCDQYSRWRSHAFTIGDARWSPTPRWLEAVTVPGTNGRRLSLRVDGDPRTEVRAGSAIFEKWSGYYDDYDDTIVIDGPGKWPICFDSVSDEFVGGDFGIVHPDSDDYFDCYMGKNPKIHFTDDVPAGLSSVNVIAMDIDRRSDFSPLPGSFKDGDFLHVKGLDPSYCDGDNTPNQPLYLHFRDDDGDDDEWLMFDPRVRLVDNTAESPNDTDELGVVKEQGANCGNAPRTFLNEKDCVLTTAPSCRDNHRVPDVEVVFDSETLGLIHDATGQYLYSVEGLRPALSPCAPDTRSRWSRVVGSASACDAATPLPADTLETLRYFLKHRNWRDATGDLRDFWFSQDDEENFACDVGATTPVHPDAAAAEEEEGGPPSPLRVRVDGLCWELVHPHHTAVFDFTNWVAAHPGGPDKITQFADDDGGFVLTFPESHEMWRWDYNVYNEVYYVNEALGDTVNLRMFAEGMENDVADALMEALGIEGDVTDTGVVVCGSINEVGTDFSRGETGLAMVLGEDDGDVAWYDLVNQKQAVWADVVLNEDDQLRQRMAWALAQIFAVDPNVLEEDPITESFLNYYDIFVRNAFGNYYDVLKEVSYSPFMAEMLTYINSRSAAYVYEQEGVVSFADENFAREIMQLFTIGTDMLNMDGTTVLDSAGEPVLTYDNGHIMSFARAWTGFDWQESRGNVETRSWANRIDPMRIRGEWRDMFPKIDLRGGYVGDGYPLCEDMPARSFLRKGAKYVLLGSSTTMESSFNINEWYDIDPKSIAVGLDASSDLYEELCKPDSMGSCTFASAQVVLDHNLPCHGVECEVDKVKIVRVTDNVFFEYVRAPCVEMSYYEGAKLMSDEWRWREQCGNPSTEAAGEACCSNEDNDDYLWTDEKNCRYLSEQMTFATAQDRCNDVGKELCSYQELWCEEDACCDFKEFLHWTTAPCYLKTKIQDETGYIAIVHETPSQKDDGEIMGRFHAENNNYFPVHWAGDYPKTSNGCGGGTCDAIVNGCVCYTNVENTIVFDSAPSNADDVVSKLFVGSVSTDTFDVNHYESPIAEGNVKVYFRSGQSYDMDTVFEVNGAFYKNVQSNVRMVASPNKTDRINSRAFYFRNPPHFMSFNYYYDNLDNRDAHYETEAVLKHYFQHPNVPPFLAIHFIQRFEISNPSLRYVETVATAFKDGTYVSEDGSVTYGSGEYGDLGAMVAAIVLDREARSVVLDLDPTKGSLREPVLKVYGLMRSMEYTPFDFRNSPRRGQRLDELTRKIGQMPFDYPSIFSFFLRDFSPMGPVQQSSLVAPEAQRYTTPKVMGLLNGMFSLIKYGLNNCYNGFGSYVDNGSWWCEGEGKYDHAWGKLAYEPDDNDAEKTVDELATLMTAGRLNKESRKIIKDEMEKVDPNAGLRLAQQLIAITPEFHSTSSTAFNGEGVQEPEIAKPSSRSRKAVVYLSLDGGMDSFNLIVPHSGCSKDVYSEYSVARGPIGLDKSSLFKIDTGGVDQVCETFGIHRDLPILNSLYRDNDLTFFANVGVLFEIVNKDNWEHKTPTQLFAHNVQQVDTQQIDPMKENYGTGILGRMADALTADGYKTGSFSIGGESYALIGELQKSPTVKFLEPWSVPRFNDNPSTPHMQSTMFELNRPTTATSGILGRTWSTMLNEYVHQTEQMNKALSSVQQNTEFPETHLGSSLKMVSSIMQLKDTLGNDRQFFFVETGGWDTHDQQLPQDAILIPELNAAIDAFVKEMKSLGYWDDVVLVCTSEFARTLTINGSQGSDHGWGGNYFILGGAVKSGKILGKYPDNLTDNGPLNIGRGRFIPTTSWDSIWNGISEWTGITDPSKLTEVMPNRGNFDLFTKDDLFE